VIVSEVTVTGDGTVEVPRRPGLGFEVDLDYINAKTQSLERILARAPEARPRASSDMSGLFTRGF
jgi:hypothetical protein